MKFSEADGHGLEKLGWHSAIYRVSQEEGTKLRESSLC